MTAEDNWDEILVYEGARRPHPAASEKRILVVDDDTRTVEVVRLYLEKEGYRVFPAYNGTEALDLARRLEPDLIVLDLMLPSMDGLAVCRELRLESDVPVIMLTARVTEQDKLVGLDVGADDYVTKPFSPRELVARVRTVLRRPRLTTREPTSYTFGDLHIDLFSHEVRLRGKVITLTPSEFRILTALARHPGLPLGRLQLIEETTSTTTLGVERTVDMHILNLRRKLGLSAREQGWIETVPGLGYRFNPEPQI